MSIDQFAFDLCVHGTAKMHVDDTTPDWTKKCIVCDATPIVPFSEMCGPCTFGEADTAEGNWV